MTRLATRGLAVDAGPRRLVAGLDLALEAGMFVAVLGRNGTGKTLLLHTLAGLRPPDAGAVEVDGTALAALPRRAIARHIALLAQDSEPGEAGTVAEFVALGRYAQASPWGGPSAEDLAAARAAMRAADIESLEARGTGSLSGGELRRAAMALVLAQSAPVMLLDEPTNHLDPHHCMRLIEVFAARARAGALVVATLHDPGLAAHFATHVLLLFGDGRSRFGAAVDLLHADLLGEVYATPMLELRGDTRRGFVARGG